MSDCVFRSTNKIVLAAAAERALASAEWTESIEALGREVFGRRAKVRFFAYSGGRFCGFDHKPVPGWKYGTGKLADVLIPDRRTTEGRRWARRLEPLAHRREVACPGMPAMQMDANVGALCSGVILRYPAWDKLGRTVWCRWGSRPDPRTVDAELWSEAKLSLFYAAVEREEAMGTKVKV